MKPDVFFPHAFRDMLEIQSFTLFDWIRYTVEDPVRRKQLKKIYGSHQIVLHEAPASRRLHQPWPGGLADHLAQMCRLARLLFEHGHGELRGNWPFNWDSVMVAIICHDAEKFVKYSIPDEEWDAYRATHYDGAEWEGIKWRVIEEWGTKFGLKLLPKERNAVKYTHGEGNDYRKDRRVSGRLAALVGAADRLSARGLFDVGRGYGW